MSERVVVLIDGGFVRKKLNAQLKRRPTSKDIMAISDSLLSHDAVKSMTLFRVYYYDAEPLDQAVTNPISHVKADLGKSDQASHNRALFEALQFEPHVAVRRGKTIHKGWKLGNFALKNITRCPRMIVASDLVPDIGQKGVDMRIGLDIAWISLKRIADVIVLVAGDSDFVPAMKFARREGLRVYLAPLGHGIFSELKVHADLVL